ncbi:MAG: type II/IV secretion system ATPase subunit [Thermoprotei archaeon]
MALPKLKLPSVKLPAPALKTSARESKEEESEIVERLKSLSVSLLPISTEPIVPQGEIYANYEIDMMNAVPGEIKDSFKNAGILFNVPNPQVLIVYDDEKGIYRYYLTEPPIDKLKLYLYLKLIEEVERYLMTGAQTIDLGSILLQMNKIYRNLPIFLGERAGLKELTVDMKVSLYYLLRNMFGYNVITPFLLDPKIEDISVSGVNLPVYVYQKDFEYTPTNLVLRTEMKVLGYTVPGEDILDELVLRFISLANRTISLANPIADGILPNGYRIAATFRREVSASGSSFVIRKFAESPITILDLINSGVLSAEVAAYLWYAIDMKMSFMVIGVTGAGKTTVMTAILNLVRENMKIVSIEDIPEIKLAQDNWVALVARPAYGEGAKEISLMDLLKLSLRYRPDVIVVGEIRGQEAYVLFQAISTGHGGATTFHAYDSESAIRRLMNEPINIPNEWIPMMNLIITVRRLPLYTGDKIILRRRVVAIDEIVSYNDLRRTVRWIPTNDTHAFDFDAARILRERIEEAGKSYDEVRAEIERRAMYLKLLASSKEIVLHPESYKLVKKYIIKYAIRPDEAIREVQSMASTGILS